MPADDCTTGGERLDGWKEIASYLKRSARTVQRWQERGLPIHHHRDVRAVYAYRSELNAWLSAYPGEHEEAAERQFEGTAPSKEVIRQDRSGVPVSPWIAVACTAAVLILAIVVLKFPTGSHPGPSHSPPSSLAVLGFVNLSGRVETAWLSTALTELFRAEMTNGDKLLSPPGEDVSRMKRDLAVLDAASLSRDTLRKIHSNLGADLVVLGSYFSLGKETDQIRLNAILQDARTGETIASISETGTQSTLLELVSRAGLQMRSKLGIGDLSATDAINLKSALPRDLEAQRLYAEGLEKLRVLDAVAARDVLLRAVQLEPGYALGHSALSDAWAALGYDAKAQEEALVAFGRSASLSPEEALSIEAKCREWAREWDKTIEIYNRLRRFAPDNLEYQLSLARAQMQAGRVQESLATIVETRLRRSGYARDPRLDLAEALIAESLGDFKRELSVAVRAAQNAEARGARLLMAQSLLRQCWAFYNLGEPKPAIDRAEKARRMFADVRDRVGEAQALKNIADVMDDAGDHVNAQKTYEEALAIFRGIGYQAGVAATLNNLGYAIESEGDLVQAKKIFEASFNVSQTIADRPRGALALNGVAIIQWRQGDLTGAKRTFEDALRTLVKYNDKSRAATVLGNIAIILQDQGYLAASRNRFEESLVMLRELDDKRGQARTQGNLGELLIRQGDLAEAKKRFEEQLAIGRTMPEGRQCAYALYGLGEVLLAQGDLETAKSKHQEALALRAKMGETGLVAESRLALAEVSLEEANPVAAESAAREAAEEFRKENETDEQAYAEAVLAKALAEQRKYVQALEVTEIANERARKSEDRAVRVATAIIDARIRAIAGHAADATKELQSTLKEATEFGYVGYQLEARLVLGEVELKSAKPTADALLAGLEKQARNKGFGLIARKAAAARKVHASTAVCSTGVSIRPTNLTTRCRTPMALAADPRMQTDAFAPRRRERPNFPRVWVHVASGKSDGGKYDTDDGQSPGIIWAHAEQQAGEQPRQPQRAEHADGEAGDRE